MQLVNPDLRGELIALDGQINTAYAVYEGSERIVKYDAAYSNDRDQALVNYNNLVNHFERRRQDYDKLEISAPISGFVLAPAYSEKTTNEDGRLPQWHGTPLESRNQGALLREGTVVCEIVPDVKKFEAVLAIDQSDLEFIQRDQDVEIWIKQNPLHLYQSKIDLISPVKMKAVPKCLSSRFGVPLVTTAGPNGQDQPQSSTFQVSVPFTDESGLVFSGSSGVAKIRAGKRTVGQRLWRLVCQTFRFEL